ncbi:MAG TPA: O-acetyl-ADP-ribose deacetylase [Spirochaetota bacterium]|nr:O-acetyl-ADP-ribose deacetylase [Spirochaetota bacterium]
MSIRILTGDITKIKTEAIVNAANSSLCGGGGVDGAIHAAGGPAILNECRAIRKTRGKLPPGEAVITQAGYLPAKYVIHTVGPVWRGGKRNEAKLLYNCYQNSLALARKNDLKIVSFPAISTGVYGFPKAKAAAVVSSILNEYSELSFFKEIMFVFFSKKDEHIFQNNL